METLRRDLALALRSLRRRPVFGGVVALTLGLGIGANTAVFGVVDAVLLRALPYSAPERLVVLWGELPEQGRLDSHLSGPELAALWEGARSFEAMGAVFARPGVLRGDGLPVEELEIGWVTPGFLEALGIRPLIGRLPTREEHLADPSTVIVLGFELWQRRYQGDPGILGRVVDFDGERRTVVGVMPSGFRMLFPPDQGVPEALAAWLPWGGSDYGGMPRSFRAFTPVARLGPGVTPGQAARELRTLAARVKEESVEYGRSGFGLRLEPLGEGVVARVRPTLLVLLAVASLVLLVACANAANLTLARAAETERDLRVRAALGAGRGRLFRQMITESAVLGGLGAGVGVPLADAGLRLVRLLQPGGIPRVEDASLDPRALLCSAATAVAASLLFGGVAAWQALRALGAAPLLEGSRTGVPGPTRVRGLLVVGELALSLVLLAGAGLLVRSFVHRLGIDPGFDPRQVLTARISLPDVSYRYRDQGPKIAAFYRRLDERLRHLPGVRAAGATTAPPLSGAALRARPYAWRGAEGATEWGSTAAHYVTVTPGWFPAVGARLLAGRWLSERDDRQGPVAVVVDAALAGRAWPGTSAVGQPIRVEVFRDGDFQPVWGEVVGVVETLRLDRLELVAREQVYLAHAQSPQRTMHPTLRTNGDPRALLPVLRREVSLLERDLPVFDARLAEEHVASATAVSRFALVTLVAFAAVAVLLAAAGVYAVMSHHVTARSFEIGMRLALGASPGRILGLVVGRGLAIAGAGVAVGLVLALAFTRVLSSLLYGVAPHDPPTLGGVALLLTGIALLACWAPARKASRTEAATVLRSP